MIKSQTKRRRGRQGFTLVELLVVMSVILLLISISFAAMNSALGSARQRATQATILKVHGLMQQRVEAFNRALDKLNLAPARLKLQRDLSFMNLYPTDKALQILVRKQIYQTRFPQTFAENTTVTSASNYVSSAHNSNTESAAQLYWILTKSEIYGVAPVDESEFSSSEVRDTDGDGLMEFVDGWGHPLRFYRWPTHLIRNGFVPGGPNVAPGVVSVSGTPTVIKYSPVDRNYPSVLWSGLPAAPGTSGGFDPLARDPDDSTGELRRFVLNAFSPVAAMTYLQNTFHTPDTYHAFLIVSPGADNVLGLGEPYTPSSAPVLGSTPGQGRLAGLVDSTYPAIQDSPINDNITNRRR